MNKQVKNSKRNKKEIQQEYAAVIFLDYIANFAEASHFNMPPYFKEELGINDIPLFTRRMVKKYYLKKTKAGGYRVTEKGRAFTEKNSDYIRFFNLAIPYADIREYEETRKHIKGSFKFEEVMITLLLKKIEFFRNEDDYASVRESHMEIAKLYEALSMKPQALYHYLSFLYFQINGLEYYDDFIGCISGAITAEELKNKYAGVYISVDVINKIKKLGDIYFDDMADRVYEKNKISINLCNKENFKRLVKEIISGDYKSVRWQDSFREYFYKVIKISDGLNQKIRAEQEKK